MTDGKPPESPVLESPSISLSDARDKTIDLLSECFAQDLLSMNDFERRLTLAHNARTMPELGSALKGLRPAVGTAGADREGPLATIPRYAPDVPATRVRPTDRAIAVFGETKRVGRWIPAERNTAVAVMGSSVIDLREALLGPGESVFTAVAVMGSVEVIVPPELHVQCAGSALFGSFEQREDRHSLGGPDAPSVRIDGFAFFGSVEVDVRYVGETRRDAKRRRRREKKERRRNRRYRR